MTKYAPPRSESIARSMGHLGLPAAAIWGSLGYLPKSVIIATDPFQLTVWVIFMAMGLVAAFACWRGHYLLEYSVLPFMTAGVLIYLVALVNIVGTRENPNSGVPMFLMFALSSYITARWFSLNQLLDGPLKLLFKRRTGTDE